MYKSLLCLVLVAALTTCSKQMCGCDTPPPVYFKATVLEQQEGNCNKPLILFEDSAGICAHMGISSARYVASKLPDSLLVNGKKISVLAGALQANEEFACSGYPHIRIYSATGAT